MLQWVHGLSTVGDDRSPSLRRMRTHPASMGPRPFDRGRPAHRPGCARRHRPSFNGSTAFRPWETRLERFLPPPGPKLQWVHGLSTVGDVSRLRMATGRRCFNGSTAFRPWETDMAGFAQMGADLASMGPRPFDRGRLDRTLAAFDRCKAASMGPRPFDRGRHAALHAWHAAW